jgi:hypothetical protein
MPFAATSSRHPARVQFQRNAFLRNDTGGLNFTNDRSQFLGSAKRQPQIASSTPWLAANRFGHSKAPQYPNDGGVVPATATLRHHSTAVQLSRYGPAGNEAGRLQFANRRSEGRLNRFPLFQNCLGWLWY